MSFHTCSCAAASYDCNYPYLHIEPELVDFDHGSMRFEAFVETSTPTQCFAQYYDCFYSCYFCNSNEILLDNKSDRRGCPTTGNYFQFKFNEPVCINDTKLGFVKYQGRVHFAEGYFCGVELEEEDGKHDGRIDNTR